MPKEPLQNLELHSIYGAKQQKGLVQLLLNGEVISTWDIPKAREIARMLQECIEAAITDEMLVNFFKTKLNMDDERCALLLRDFRLLRQGQLEAVNPFRE
jgi:hypothetical protein